MSSVQSVVGSQGVGSTTASTTATVTAVLGMLGLLAFAAVNVQFEGTNHFADGPLAGYASGLTVMNWLVVSLKLFGAVVLMLSVSKRATAFAPNTMALLLWGAFGTFAIYALGTIGEAAALATGIAGGPDDIDAPGVVYLLGTVFFAACFGVAASSYSRRTRWRPAPIVAGLLGAPILLAGILVLVPTLLVALGVMPAL
ncbi:hypothetical protein [Agromyces ramosus]|uniref:Uncharacterized protein n=1 Tax=Agromyces ramosus TaxID=33879 RepID=A0ABU0R521_9MICO|nr:hypothetical protein [Agromyces ramosus]MDQ0893178.1 hypothetical protein [Agromyces ramosus]